MQLKEPKIIKKKTFKIKNQKLKLKKKHEKKEKIIIMIYGKVYLYDFCAFL